MPKDVEIELQFPLKNEKQVKSFLEKNAEPKLKDVSQRCTYYVPSHRNFLVNKYPYEWLRVRESGNVASINYKHFYPENVQKTDYCDEFESKIENAETVKKILEALDFRPVVVVEKKRSTWDYRDVEVAIDNVKGLGSFIELEAKKQFSIPKDGKKFLHGILKELHAKVGKEEFGGYPKMLLDRKESSR